MHIVIARYNESIDWLNDIEYSYTVYNKGLPDIEFEYTQLLNTGRESDTYLYHIVTNYDTIDQPIAFLQGKPFEHCSNLLEILKNNTNTESVVSLSDYIATDDRDGNPHHYGLPIGAVLDEIIFPNRMFNSFDFSTGAQYIVPVNCIKSKSHTWWNNVYETHTKWTNGAAGTAGPWIFERLWPVIWNYKESR